MLLVTIRQRWMKVVGCSRAEPESHIRPRSNLNDTLRWEVVDGVECTSNNMVMCEDSWGSKVSSTEIPGSLYAESNVAFLS
jgi:hypothetical protein